MLEIVKFDPSDRNHEKKFIIAPYRRCVTIPARAKHPHLRAFFGMPISVDWECTDVGAGIDVVRIEHYSDGRNRCLPTRRIPRDDLDGEIDTFAGSKITLKVC